MATRDLSTLRPTDDEVCVSILFGQDPSTAPMDLARVPVDARPVIEARLLTALRRGPVWVAFSGGRDSSALLAIAAAVARREGLPLPIPATLVFPGVSATEEEDWQRLVLEHLGLEADWVRVEPGVDLDLLGPYAQRVLDHAGVVLPSNAHALLPLLDRLGESGTLVTGGGGDDLMEGRPQRLTSALLSRVRPTRSELEQGVLNDLPRPLMRRALPARSLMVGLHWITPALRGRLLELELRDRLEFPIRFDRLLQRAWSDRYFQMAGEAYAWMPLPPGVEVLQPFHTHDVVGAFARTWGRRYPGGRVHSLQRLVGDLLPYAAMARASKAEFVDVFVTDRTRSWVREWDGTGVDPERVDLDRLRAEWESEMPHYCTFALLHQAWLHRQRASAALVD